MGSHSYSGKRKFNQVKAHWTPANHEVFIDLCLEQISAGNKPGAHFTIQGWRNILESFQSITGLEYDRIQLKNHWDLTKRQWKVWHDLVSNERLKWDPCTRKFGASDQEWNEILKANPDAAQFRSKELQFADKLEMIFSGTADFEVTEIHNRRGKKVNCFTEAEPITRCNDYAAEKEPPNPPYGYGLMNTEEPIIVGPEGNVGRCYDAVESRSTVTVQSPPFKFSYNIAECIKCLDSIEEIEQAMETGVASCARPAVLPNALSSTALASPRSLYPSSTSKSLKASSIFGESLRASPKSSLKAVKGKNPSLVTKCEIGDSLEEFLSKSTSDKGLIRLMMCMGEALRTIAFKVRTASCGGTACVNSFGDEQLAVDMLADKLLFEALQYSHHCKYACSEEVPELQDMGGPAEGGFSVAFDPLDGSSIVDTNFTVGTIFGVWPGDKLTGVTGAQQVAAAMGIFGPRTTYVLALKDVPGTHEFLLLDEGKWQHVKDTTSIGEGKMFSPGNLRATSDNPDYAKLIDYYVREKYTLRYTGGMVPDVNQIIVKEKGIFTNVTSPTAKAKLRLLFEVAPLGFLIEKAGGYSSDGKQSVLDKVIVNLDDRTQVAYGSKNEIIRFEETLYGSSRLKVSEPVGAAA